MNSYEQEKARISALPPAQQKTIGEQAAAQAPDLMKLKRKVDASKAVRRGLKAALQKVM